MLIFVLAGGSNTSSIAGTPPATRSILEPAGPYPSDSARMVCTPKTQSELTTALGIAATTVTTPTWTNHLYACQYEYANGTMGVSIKELSSRAETTTYFTSLRTQFGQSEWLQGVAQGAFVTANGSLVLRKDYKVLFVDTSALTVPLGSGFKNRNQVAVAVGITVLGCWTGA